MVGGLGLLGLGFGVRSLRIGGLDCRVWGFGFIGGPSKVIRHPPEDPNKAVLRVMCWS